jgi:sugar phosphate permease
MWSAMIKVTHEIGGESTRASAMGFLEGGRGLVAAAMGSFLVYLVGTQSDSDGLIIDKVYALNSVYLTISIFMLLVAFIVWFGLKGVESQEARAHDWSLDKALIVAKDLNLWLLAIIILCAYCSYKNIGNFPVYMNEVKGVSILDASKFTSYIFWARPISALLAGVFADRLTLKVKGGRFIVLMICFILGSLCQFLLVFDVLNGFTMLLSSIILGASFAYALRAIYFSVFGDFKISDNIVGTAIGIVSLVGYLPDFFFGVFTGYLIDEFPGKLGFTYVFGFNATLLFIGALAAFICYRRTI